jgi:16S rRNA (cytosine967-C5)-methyltransferase
MSSPRRLALDILLKVESEQSYSNIAIDAALAKSGLGERDAAFVTALTYGVLETRLRLDWLLKGCLSGSINKLKPKVLEILRLGAYQMVYMDKIPPRSAVDESVKLTKTSGCAWASGLVNAVLRKLSSELGSLPEPDMASDPVGGLEIEYSCPRALIERWQADYGAERTIGILSSLSGRPPAAARVNTLRTTPDELVKSLAEHGVQACVPENAAFAKTSIEFGRMPELRNLDEFRRGLFFMQDFASQLCCLAVGPEPGGSVIDMCAAPGGKSFSLAMMMEGRGSVTACELYENRIGLINDGAKRLGLTGVIKTLCCDSSGPVKELGLADRVLCDVPCSGLGAIRRKPEIRYKDPAGFDLLPDLQYSILCEGSGHVAPGGRLVYSTCTLSGDENGCVAERFLREHPDFSPEPPDDGLIGSADAEISGQGNCVTLFPRRGGSDGFFFARFRRER